MTSRSQLMILVVEDEDELRALTSEELADAGYRVSEAATVALARDILTTEAVDLVVTDLKMPGEDGLALLRWMQMRPGMPPAIVVSGVTDPATRRSVGEAGAVVMLGKPCGDGELEKAVAEVLAER